MAFGKSLFERDFSHSVLTQRLVSSLTEYSLDVEHLTQHLTEDFYLNYFYTHLIQIVSFIVALPLVYV